MLRSRRTRYVTALILAGLAILLVRAAFPPRYERAEWMAGYLDSSRLDARNPMVPDLQRRHLKPGMPRAEVLSLLGPPSDREGDALVYMMGFPHDLLATLLGGWDQDYLRLTFDKQGRLVDSRVLSG